MAKEKRNDIEIVTDSDFVYVQKDEHIHDKKFQTKPTTFFKDALRRFAKNKSSVIGAIILQAINYALQFLGVNPYIQYIIRGLIIILAVSIDVRKYIVKK